MKTSFLSRNPGGQLSILPEHNAEDSVAEVKELNVDHISSNIGNESRRTEELYHDDGKLSPTSQRYQYAQLQHDEPLQRRGWFVTFVSRRITLPKRAWRSLDARRLAISTEKAKSPRHGLFLFPTIEPYSSACLAWMSFMLLFDLTYTAFWVPLDVGFCTTEERSHIYWSNMAESSCSITDLVGGIIYSVNLILAFQWAAIFEHDNQEYVELDGPTVMKHYMLYGRFFIDIVAVVPFVYLIVILSTDNIGGTASSQWIVILSLIRLLRLVRLVSISKVVYLNGVPSKNDNKEDEGFRLSVSTIYILLLTYLLCVCINLETCIMLLIAYLEGVGHSWLDALKWNDFTVAPPAEQWYCGVYWIITTSTTTGYGDITPQSIPEQVFANIYMILGLVFFGLLVGTISNATTRASGEAHKLYKFRQKITRVEVWLRDHHVPASTRKEVQAYFTQVWAAREDMTLDAEIFADLPHYLRQTIAAFVMLDTISSFKLFKGREHGLEQLVAQHMRPVDIAPGSDLCQQGEEGDRMWVLMEGEVLALQHLAEPVRLAAPCLIGDSIILADDIPAFRSRSFTIRTLDSSTCKVWELRVGSLWPIMRMYPSLRLLMMEHVRNQTMVKLAVGLAPEPWRCDGEDEEEERDDSTKKLCNGHRSREDMRGWCEATASISRALLMQPQETVDICMEELRKAKSEDGSLQALLDLMLEYSQTQGHQLDSMRHGDDDNSTHSNSKFFSFTQARMNSAPALRPLNSMSVKASRRHLMNSRSVVTRINSNRLSTMSVGMPKSHSMATSSLRSRSVERPTTVHEDEEGFPDEPVKIQLPNHSDVVQPKDARHGNSGTGLAVVEEGMPTFLLGPPSDLVSSATSAWKSSEVVNRRPPKPPTWSATDPIDENLPFNTGRNSRGLTLPASATADSLATKSGGNTTTTVPLTSNEPPNSVVLPAASAASASSTSLGAVQVCPTCGRVVCPTCCGTLPGAPASRGASGPASSAGWASISRPSVATSGTDSVRSALGLNSSTHSSAQHWRPSRLGRQTLFRISSLVDRGGLGSTSVPVQEFGVGYTNFG
ncbi:hypothetical protein CEUSTIGMA_g8193.t1 [Chlamydomonas eustigma]|uniref:Cyclic nucleotide-binding domain-containing protein n=1 Tax=Chlamydomonas eustigma TaxID=1157962 RepID=A0A250XCE9_9CHLO|nr:hypothetical protein CEUSTIGMA_g8193.t1 [Chlamydomonas eustigma]|eukprot:GAX80758.1 hypothetical protein CEUSTIGMA_g8193.t1 [Chlamydomonas eustigma]